MSTSDQTDYVETAAQFNLRILRRLQNALTKQPDVDLLTVLRPSYQTMLASRKDSTLPNPTSARRKKTSPPPDAPRRPLWTFDSTSPANIVYQLSSQVQARLDEEDSRWRENGQVLSLAMSRILESATFLFQSKCDCNHFVARWGEDVVVKAISDIDSTEYTTLQFLETTSLMALVPKPYGVVSVGKIWYMFMSLIPGSNLETVWPKLTESQKKSLSNDLNTLLLQLREIPVASDGMLGGVAGQGCKDTRKRTRTADTPIYTCEQLWNFMYGGTHIEDTVYGRFLRQKTFPPRAHRIVLTHGDFRPANIMVHCHNNGHVQITGLIDWEMGGFYPEDFECIKALNTLFPPRENDWCLFLPECISPRHYIESCHAERVWDPYVS